MCAAFENSGVLQDGNSGKDSSQPDGLGSAQGFAVLHGGKQHHSGGSGGSPDRGTLKIGAHEYCKVRGSTLWLC